VKVNWQAASLGVLATCFMFVAFGILFHTDEMMDVIHLLTLTRLHATSQELELFTVKTVGTSNPTKNILVF
jgi:hypothetical protein